MTEVDGEDAGILELMADQHYDLLCLAAAQDELSNAGKGSDPDRVTAVYKEQVARLEAIKQRDTALSKAYDLFCAERPPGDERCLEVHRSLRTLSRALGIAEGVSTNALDATLDMATMLQELLSDHREAWSPTPEPPV